jgi:hypothetical protein
MLGVSTTYCKYCPPASLTLKPSLALSGRRMDNLIAACAGKETVTDDLHTAAT